MLADLLDDAQRGGASDAYLLDDAQRGGASDAYLLDDAQRGGASDVYLLLDVRRAVPIAAACLARVIPTCPPADAPAAALAQSLAGGVGGVPGVLTVEGRQVATVRRAVSEPVAEGSPEIATTRLEVYAPFPDGAGMLLLSFSTPIAGVAREMVTLFEAMAESTRWRWQ